MCIFHQDTHSDKFNNYWTENVASRSYAKQKADDIRQTQHYHNSSLRALRAQVS